MDALTDEDYNQPLHLTLTLSLDSLEEALRERFLNDDGIVHAARYDAAARHVVIDVDLTLESGMSAGSWESHLGQTYVEVPFEAASRGGTADQGTA